MITRLDLFDARIGLIRGKPAWIEALWYFTKCIFFLSPYPWPYSFKAFLLRLYGANIGQKIVIKPRVNIHFPWKLSIGNHSWIGEEVYILNLENVHIGDNVCISQRAFLCTGNHNYRDSRFLYRNSPIIINSGAWVGASTFIGPGIVMGVESIASAGSVVLQSIPDNFIAKGNPAFPCGERWQRSN